MTALERRAQRLRRAGRRSPPRARSSGRRSGGRRFASGARARPGVPRRGAASGTGPRARGSDRRRAWRPTTSRRMRCVCTASYRSGETRQPSAEKAPEWAGTTTRAIPAWRASAPACTGPGAAVGDQRELAQIVAALHRDQAERPQHVRVGHLDHARGRPRAARGRSGAASGSSAARRALAIEPDGAAVRSARGRDSRGARLASLTVGLGRRPGRSTRAPGLRAGALRARP